jgi:hypothetical protein
MVDSLEDDHAQNGPKPVLDITLYLTTRILVQRLNDGNHTPRGLPGERSRRVARAFDHRDAERGCDEAGDFDIAPDFSSRLRAIRAGLVMYGPCLV